MLVSNKNKAIIAKQKCYLDMMGLIIFIMIKVKPNIAFATFIISHFTKNSFNQYNKAMKTFL